MANLIAINEYAAQIGKAPVSVRQKCQRGNVPGAIKVGRDWLIPADAEYPDKRISSGKYIHGNERRSTMKTYGRDSTSLILTKAAKAVYSDSDPLIIAEFETDNGLRYNISGIIERSDLTSDEVNEALESLGTTDI